MSIYILPLGVQTNKRFIAEYEKHLSPWRRNASTALYAFFPWEDLADPNTHVALFANITAADILVCFVSADFLIELSSIDFLWSALYEKSQDERFRVIPVIVEECAWKEDLIFSAKQYVKFYHLKDAYQAVMALRASIENLAEERKNNPLVTTVLSAPRYCRGCGARLDVGAVFCTDCGRQVGQAVLPTTFQDRYHP